MVTDTNISEWLARYLPARLNSVRARVMLLATGMVESGFTERRQIVRGAATGPAAGFWQFEQGGGVAGVLTHSASREMAAKACEAFGVPASSHAVWQAIQSPANDGLACVLARLLYYTDPKPLPAVSDEQGAWAYYIRTWRPGKPDRRRFAKAHAWAMEALV